MQLLRTYPRRVGGYEFAPRGERSVARGYTKAVNLARHLIYIEDQYLWSPVVAAMFEAVLKRNTDLYLSAAFYWPESPDGVPVYVHAKVCVIDDQWASTGSDNFNHRSWTHDSELSLAVCDPGYARALRLDLAREHLDRAGPVDDLVDPKEAFTAFADSAARLQLWYDGGCRGARPPGRLRPVNDGTLTRFTRAWATPLYHLVYDPDGRPVSLRCAAPSETLT